MLAYNKPYKLEIGQGHIDKDNKVYIVINEETGVIEYETRILPQAIKIVDELAIALAAFQDMHSESKASNASMNEDMEISREELNNIINIPRNKH